MPNPEERLQIFISSPGDVGQERVVAERVVERLRGEFAGRAALQPVRWEREPLRATEHPQEQITPPAETDIAVFILWSRLGTPLPEDKFQKDSGKQYRSGTEWEFENAIEGYREAGTPDLLTYRKTKDPRATLSDKEELQRRLEQKDALESFIDRWFKGEEGTFRAAFHTFETPDEFERRLEEHLRSLIEEKVPARATGREEPEARWHKGSPFRGLRAFEQEHAPVFFGRTKEVGEVIEALKAQAGEGEPFVLVTGPSGSGKSSLVKAGVASTLTEPGVAEGIGYWRQASLRPSDASKGPVSGLARSLLSEDAVPQIKRLGFDAEGLSGLLREAPARAADPIEQALQEEAKAVAEKEGLPEPPEARLLLVIDQMEELFTLDEVGTEEREAFARALQAIVEHGPAWALATMRSDFYPRAAEVDTLHTLMQGTGQYALPTPSFAEIGQMIRYPAQAAGLQFERDPDRGESLDEVLHESAAGEPEALPLLEFTLEELYQRREEDVLTFEAYEELGGLEGAIAERAEEVYQETSAEAKAAFSEVMERLVTIRQGEEGGGAAASRRVPIEEIARTDAREALVESFVEARLLVTGRNDAGEAVVSLAHEALLREWPRLREWVDRNRSFLQSRARVRERATRWMGEERAEDLLLPTGQPLAEGRGLLEEREEALGETVRAYVEQSIERAERQRRRRRQVVGGIAATFFLVVAGFGLFSYQQWTESAEQRDQALRSQSQYLAEQARSQVKAGDGMTGMLLALEALPEDMSNPDRPYVPEAQSALYDALMHAREQAFYDPHSGPITDAALGPEGRYLVTASEDSTARIHDLDRQEVTATLSGHGASVNGVDLDSSASRVITAGGTTAKVWEVPSGDLVQTLKHDGDVEYPSLSDGGERVLTSILQREAGSTRVTLWSTDGGMKRSTRTDWYTTAVFVPGRPYIFGMTNMRGEESKIRLWTQDLQEHSVTSIGIGRLRAGVLPDGGKRLIVSGLNRKGQSYGTTVQSLLIPELKVENTVSTRHSYMEGASNISEDVATVENGAADSLLVIDPVSGRKLNRLYLPGAQDLYSFGPDNQRLITGSEDGTIRIRRLPGGKEIDRFAGRISDYQLLGFRPDAERVVAVGNAEVQMWTTREKPEVENLGRGKARAIGPNGKFLVRVDSLNRTYLMTLPSGQTERYLSAFDDPVSAVAFSSEARKVAIGARNGIVRLFKTRTGKEITHLRSGSSPREIEIAREGSRILVFSRKDKINRIGNVNMWKVSNKNRLVRIDSSVTSMSVTPDGKRLLIIKKPESGGASRTRRPSHNSKKDSVVFTVRSTKDGSVQTEFGKTSSINRVMNTPVQAESRRRSLEVSPNGKYAVLGRDSISIIVNIEEGNVYDSVEVKIGKYPFGVGLFGPKSDIVAISDGEPRGKVRPKVILYSLNDKKIIDTLNIDKNIEYILPKKFNKEGNKIITYSRLSISENLANLWRLSSDNHAYLIDSLGVRRIKTGTFMGNGSKIVISENKNINVYKSGSYVSNRIMEEVARLRHSNRIGFNYYPLRSGHILTSPIGGPSRVWPLFDSPQALIDSARANVTRTLTESQREEFNLRTTEQTPSSSQMNRR